MNATKTSVLDRLLTPVGHCLTQESARALVNCRADPETQARVSELATKCNEATLTAEERAEYETYVWASSVIAILQAKARTLLARNGPAGP